MNTVRRILVPLDFSEHSANGLNYAVSLARKTQAEITVLYVAQKAERDALLELLVMLEGYPTLNPPAAIPVDRLLREKALDLYHFIEKVVMNRDAVKIKRRVSMGNKAEKILRVVTEERIDLVVLPVRKTSFFRDLMARGKLLRMISRFPCPVLLKPSPDEVAPPSGFIGRSIFAR
jgi:nucleotide-binding universal stress UspA family protein